MQLKVRFYEEFLHIRMYFQKLDRAGGVAFLDNNVLPFFIIRALTELGLEPSTT